MIEKYWNRYTYVGAFAVVWIMLAVSIAFLRPMIFQRLVGEYEEFGFSAFCEWEKLKIDTDSRLIEFRDSNGRDIGIEATYEFTDIDDEIIEARYREKIAALKWEYISEEDGRVHYRKDGLELFVSHKAPRVWQIYITPQGFHDKGVLERLLFGNKRT